MKILIGLIVIIFILVVIALPFVLLFKKLLKGREVQEEEIYLPYRAKPYFFSRSEQQFFNILNAHLDVHRYTIFPKVRLGDFVEVEYQDRGDRTWWNKIRSKHVDYLVWDLNENKIVLAIELDGNSHNSERMQERDEFVDSLYKKVGIRLERIAVGSVFADEIESLVCQLNK